MRTINEIICGDVRKVLPDLKTRFTCVKHLVNNESGLTFVDNSDRKHCCYFCKARPKHLFERQGLRPMIRRELSSEYE